MHSESVSLLPMPTITPQQIQKKQKLFHQVWWHQGMTETVMLCNVSKSTCHGAARIATPHHTTLLHCMSHIHLGFRPVDTDVSTIMQTPHGQTCLMSSRRNVIVLLKLRPTVPVQTNFPHPSKHSVTVWELPHQSYLLLCTLIKQIKSSVSFVVVVAQGILQNMIF